jgi:hypothetical protein
MKAAAQPDVSKFKGYRFGHDGSLYYGEVAYLNTKTGHVQASIDGLDEESKKQWRLVRHGYGLQMYSGSRNEDGVMTKYEGFWDKDKKHGDSAIAIYADGSSYRGSFRKDHMEGMGRYEWAAGHVYDGQWRESQMDGANGLFINANGREMKGTFKRNYFL